MRKKSRKRPRRKKGTFPSKLSTASTFYPRGTMSKSAKTIYSVSINPKYAPGGLGSAIKWLTYYRNRAGKNLSAKQRQEIMKATRMLQKKNKSGPYSKRKKPKSPKKSRKITRRKLSRKPRAY